MILYKNNPNMSQMNNIIGFEYIIETKYQFISITAVKDIVHSIEIDKKHLWTEKDENDIRMSLAENHDIIAFAADIRAVVGRKIYIIEKEVNPYDSNKKLL